MKGIVITGTSKNIVVEIFFRYLHKGFIIRKAYSKGIFKKTYFIEMIYFNKHEALNEAIKNENYELAAKIRDGEYDSY